MLIRIRWFYDRILVHNDSTQIDLIEADMRSLDLLLVSLMDWTGLLIYVSSLLLKRSNSPIVIQVLIHSMVLLRS